MKILMLITGLQVGGAERQVIDLADRLHARGHQVCICHMTGPALLLPASKKVPVVGLHMRKSALGFIRGYLRLRRLVRSFRPDVLHSHMVHANIMARLLRLTIPVPRIVCTAHSTNEGGRLRMIGYRATDRLADLSTNVSNEAVEIFEAQGAVPRGRMVAVHNGIDTDRFKVNLQAGEALRKQYGVDMNTPILLAVGRLVEAKDYPNLLQAFSRLASSTARLWIIGDGPLKDDLLRQAALLNIGQQVEFFGIQKNVHEWLNACDIFVLSSAWEGFGLVVAEAMACERLVVATDAGGLSEVLGDCGFLVPPRNPAALAAALEKALSLTQEERARYGARARARVISRFSIESAVDKWTLVYRGLPS